MSETTTIQIGTGVREMLKKLGAKGETYNDIIKHLLKEHEYNVFMEQQYRILENEKEWMSLDSLE